MTTTFDMPGSIRAVRHPSGLPLMELSNRHGRARVCLQGAQVLHYAPLGQPPLLWLSERSRFEAGKAIRGGIPLCWPWFGDHPSDPALPAHGFARTAPWTLRDCADDGASTCLTLGLDDSPASRRLWPFAFGLTLHIRLHRALTLTLTSHNRSDRPMPLTEALHSYFAVADSTRTRITGLEGRRYRDKLNQLRSGVQAGPLDIDGAIDRVYLNSPRKLAIEDPGNGRRILIQQAGGRSTVVWNPGRDKAAAMADMDDQGYRRMLCVESANALDHALQIPPGESHRLSTRIRSIPRRGSGDAP